MASISGELPPQSTQAELKGYLARMFNSINIALNTANYTVPQSIKPTKPRVGRQYYFKAAIALDPDITQEGLYIYKSTGWEFIV